MLDPLSRNNMIKLPGLPSAPRAARLLRLQCGLVRLRVPTSFTSCVMRVAPINESRGIVRQSVVVLSRSSPAGYGEAFTFNISITYEGQNALKIPVRKDWAS